MMPECADLIARILQENGFPRERRAQGSGVGRPNPAADRPRAARCHVAWHHGMDLCRTLARKAAFRS
jgi:hypothetical protein